jgi:tetratricopeptide (TPR) repeat protein
MTRTVVAALAVWCVAGVVAAAYSLTGSGRLQPAEGPPKGGHYQHYELSGTAAPQAPADRLLVMPFENVKREAPIFWLGEASAVLLADELNVLGANPITRTERRQAFERLQVPPAAALTDATIIRIGQIVGAAQVIVGSLERDGDDLVVHVRSIALEPGRVRNDLTERGPVSDLFAIFERIARRIVPAASAAPATVNDDHPPVAAFEDFIKGLLAETPATAINYLNAALKLQPSYDRARLALWDVYTEQGDHDKALESVQAVPARSSLAARATFLTGLSQLSLMKYDQAFATFKALADRQSPPNVLNNIGVVQLRRSTTPQTGFATYYFNRAADGDPDDPDYIFNLGYAYWQERDTQAAIYWLREAVRRNPADGDAHFVLGAALAASGNTAESTREKELAKRLSSTYADWEKRPGVPRGLERVKSEVELPHARRIATRISSNEQRDQQELAQFYLDRGRRLFQQENDRDAATELEHALYLSPYLAEAHLLLGRIHSRNGRVNQAVDAFKISLWSAETAEAHVALGDAYRQAKDAAAARAEAERALALDPTSAEAKRLLDVLKSP